MTRDAWFNLVRSQFPAVSNGVSQHDLRDEIAALEEILLQAKRHHNSLQPVSRLPPEIILLIAECLREIWPPYCDRPLYIHPHKRSPDEFHRRMDERQRVDALGWINMSHLCQFWRTLIVNNVQLWDEIDFEHLPLEWLCCILERSRGHLKKAYLEILSVFVASDLDHVSSTIEQTRGLAFFQKLMESSSTLSLESLNVKTWIPDITPVIAALRTPLPRLRTLCVGIQDYSRPAVLLPANFLDYFPALEDLSTHQFMLPIDPALCTGVFTQLRRLEMVTENWDTESHVDTLLPSMADAKLVLESMHRLEELILVDPIPMTSSWPDYALRMAQSGPMDIRLSPTVRDVFLSAISCNGDIAWLACNLVIPLSATVTVRLGSTREPVPTEDAVRAIAEKYTLSQRRPRNMKLVFTPSYRLWVELWLDDNDDRTFWSMPEEIWEERRDVVLVLGWDDPEEEMTPALLMQWLAPGLCLADLVEISLCCEMMEHPSIHDSAMDKCAALLRRAARMKRLRIDWETCGALIANHKRTGSPGAFPPVEALAIYIEPVTSYTLDIAAAKDRLAGLLEYVRLSRGTLRVLKFPVALRNSELSSFIQELDNLCSVIFHDTY
ncbi:hypothetical protein PENSPDRAFT_656292 [Peniophora sp. CONT]|nr:hypothetical protein PENSPDRAFT_656292 [Peniophora sp. CONT]